MIQKRSFPLIIIVAASFIVFNHRSSSVNMKSRDLVKHRLQVCLVLYSSERPELMNDKYYFYIIHYYLLPGDRSSAHKSPAPRISPQHHNITTSQQHNNTTASPHPHKHCYYLHIAVLEPASRLRCCYNAVYARWQLLTRNSRADDHPHSAAGHCSCTRPRHVSRVTCHA